MLAWSSRVSDPQRTKQKTRFFCVAWLKNKFVDRAYHNTSGHVLPNKVPPRNWRLSNNVQLLFIFLPSYLPVCQLDPLAAKAQQIPAGGFYMSRLINVTCFRGEREEDVWCSRASLWMLMNLSRGRTHVRVQWKWHGVYCFALRSL